MIDSAAKSPIVTAIGLFFLFSVTACQPSKTTPEEITLAFWSAVAANNLELANKYCNSASQSILSSWRHDNFKNTTFSYGKIVIDANLAHVETQIIPSIDKKSSFTTFLVKQDKHWKVDCQRSLNNLETNPLFVNLLQHLNTLEETINKQLEQYSPLIEKKIESFEHELKQQLDNLEKELKKSFPQKQKNPYQDTI